MGRRRHTLKKVHRTNKTLQRSMGWDKACAVIPEGTRCVPATDHPYYVKGKGPFRLDPEPSEDLNPHLVDWAKTYRFFIERSDIEVHYERED